MVHFLRSQKATAPYGILLLYNIFMLQSHDTLVIRILKERILALTPINRMIVFGSRARGDAVEESDLDVFIELPQITSNLRQQIVEIAWEVGLDHDTVISILLTSTPLLINSPLAGNPILRSIELEGVVV